MSSNPSCTYDQMIANGVYSRGNCCHDRMENAPSYSTKPPLYTALCSIPEAPSNTDEQRRRLSAGRARMHRGSVLRPSAQWLSPRAALLLWEFLCTCTHV